MAVVAVGRYPAEVIASCRLVSRLGFSPESALESDGVVAPSRLVSPDLPKALNYPDWVLDVSCDLYFL